MNICDPCADGGANLFEAGPARRRRVSIDKLLSGGDKCMSVAMRLK